MATIARLYNFIAGQPATADQVDAEFDQILTFLLTNVVHKDGTVAMTGALTLPSNPTAALHAATKQYVDAQVSAPAMTGVVSVFAGAAAPVGWLLCQGQAVSRATYATLFTAIGTTYGAGDGSTTFNVPDCRGRTIVGVGLGAGLTVTWTLGMKWGSEYLMQHSHSVPSIYDANYDAHTHSGKSGQLSEGSLSADGWSASNAATTIIGSGACENVPPEIAMNYIIKT